MSNDLLLVLLNSSSEDYPLDCNRYFIKCTLSYYCISVQDHCSLIASNEGVHVYCLLLALIVFYRTLFNKKVK